MYPNLKLQIWRSGIRQNHLARLLGLDESVLSRLINGFRKPSPELKTRIAALFEAEESWLFEEVETKEMVSRLQ
ncbi:MAG: helix-turn-helix domain-containing protein [Bryobacteraceae bacterium]